MRHTINKKLSYNRGFSLIEMALTLAIIGSLIGVSAQIYKNYISAEKTEKTQEHVFDMSSAIGGFRATYGRYPCPSSLTASRGDAEYGHEDADCKAGTYGVTGTCTGGICSTTSNNALAPAIVIGTLPFKTMGLQENQIYDGYGNRITYAVTAPLSASATFEMSKGGISIVDKNNDSIITPPDSAHFVVVSHGKNGVGGYSHGGSESDACTSGGANEKENCDDDALFVLSSLDDDFDDRVEYFTPIGLTYWQKTDTAFNDIYLRGGDSIAIGASVSDDLSAAESVDVKVTMRPDSGNIWAQNAYVLSNYLCEYAPAGLGDCFKSSVIGGLIADAEGLDCGDDFMIGIKNGSPVCSDEIYISCPPGQFVGGINPDGKLICKGDTYKSCKKELVPTSCGTNETIRISTANVPHGSRSYTLSGQCYLFSAASDKTRAEWKAFIETSPIKTDSEIQDEINNLNAINRVETDCKDKFEPGNNTSALIRDAYSCNNGIWDPPVSHERLNRSSQFPVDGFQLTQPHLSETTQPYDIAYDIDRSIGDHDCWCREDWRLQTSQLCGPGYDNDTALLKRVVQKSTCPATSNSFINYYEDVSLCVCDAASTDPVIEATACYEYYAALPGSLDGFVIRSWPRKCVDGASVKDEGATPDVDFSGCHCPAKEPVVNVTYCPPGTTNSYTIPGDTDPTVGVQSVEVSSWICPGPDASDGHEQPGYRGPPTIPNDIPACVCNSSYFEFVHEPCEAGLAGTGTKYKKQWDCTLNDGAGGWEAKPDWELISKDCRACSWRSSDTPYIEDYAFGQKIKSKCACGSPIGLCHDNGPNGKYNIWAGCQCVVDPI